MEYLDYFLHDQNSGEVLSADRDRHVDKFLVFPKVDRSSAHNLESLLFRSLGKLLQHFHDKTVK